MEDQNFMKKIIKKVKPKIQKLPQKKRVTAYTRVSDGKYAMLHSLSSQISYYSSYIQKNPEWLYVGVYADKAETGTNDNRPEFQRLIADCKAGKIDMIICKSITRFARNTVDTLIVTRELKKLGIDVFFETERIHSLSGDGELMLSILASYAQEESRIVSENCKWRIRKNFKEGKSTYFKIYGYEFKKGKLEIIPKEAEIVKMIFNDYLSGMRTTVIAKKLNELKIKPKLSKVWRESVISGILKNEKYVGDMLLQKSYIKDHLSKKQMKNNGELPQYYVENSHEPIISREVFEKVQNELKKRSKKPSKVQKQHLFTGKIKCEICGSNFKYKITALGTKYEKPVWICNTFNTLGKKHCGSKQIPEDILKEKLSEIGEISEIEQIIVPENGTIIFCLKNGQQIKKLWQNKPRSQSWTKKMKQKAKETALCRRHKK